MALELAQSATALGPYGTASFLASGGTEPYVYSVVPGGAGGTIDADTGVYTAPTTAASSGPTLYDTIMVTDDVADTATAVILVALPFLLLCDILETELELDPGRVYVWDQKLMQPKDADLYVAVSVGPCKPFGNTNRINDDGDQEQSVNMLAVIDIDIISRGTAARDRKEEILLALNSVYAQQQMNACSFNVGILSPNFLNLSHVDGAAIPYRYRISVNMQYAFVKTKAAPYYDDFEEAEVTTDP